MAQFDFMLKLRGTRVYDELRVIRHCIVKFREFNVKGSISLYLKIRSCHRKYGWDVDEYFLYNYDRLSIDDIQSFVTENEHLKFAGKVNPFNATAILADKWKTYENYKRLFGREACLVTSTNNGGIMN